MLRFIHAFLISTLLFISFGFGILAPRLASAEYQPSCTTQKCTFIFLAPLPIGGASGGSLAIEGEQGAESYVRSLYTFGVAIAAGLAVIMIVIGGIEMSTVDAMSGKIDGNGKKRIVAALSGLALALLSYLILSTLNVNLLSTDFVPRDFSEDVDGSIGSGDGGHALAAAPGAPGAPGVAGANGIVPGGPAAQQLNTAALNNLGVTTCSIAGTNGGRLACAYAVNKIVNDALGRPLVGAPNNDDTYGRSTRDIYLALSNSDKFILAGTNASLAQPGDIIVSPTVGGNTGHVGIYTDTGKIVSNSSSGGAIDDKFTPSSWTNYYGSNKGLTTYVYRAK